MLRWPEQPHWFVAAHDPGVVLELRRLAHGDGWQIAPTLSSALTDLFSRPL